MKKYSSIGTKPSLTWAPRAIWQEEFEKKGCEGLSSSVECDEQWIQQLVIARVDCQVIVGFLCHTSTVDASTWIRRA